MAKKNKKVLNETKGNDERPMLENDTTTENLEEGKKGLCLSLDKKLKMKLKKQKKKQKKKEFESSKVTEEPKEVEEVTEDAGVVQFPDDIDTQAKKNQFVIETIPEDLFEEFIENEEMVQTVEAIKACPGTKGSPKLKKRDPVVVHYPTAVFNPPPNVMYNYCGVSYTEPDGRVITSEGHLPGVEEIYANRILDVIMEESSEFSDASGHSDKKLGKVDSGAQKKINAVFYKDLKGEYESVEPVIVKTLKESNDYKIELIESSSESDFDLRGKVEANIQDLAKDLNSDDSTSNTTTSNSYRLTDTESWRSSINSDVYSEAERLSKISENVPDQRSRDSWNSLNSLVAYEGNDAEGLFQKQFFSKIYKSPSQQERKNEESSVNVRNIAENIKQDMDRILMSKVKIIKSCEEPNLSEKTWAYVLEDTKKGLNAKKVSDTESVKTKSANPEPLSALAEKKVLTLPCGWLVLKKIGLSSCCSKNSGSILDLDKEAYTKTENDLQAFSHDSSPISEISFNSQVRDGRQSAQSVIEFDYSSKKGESEKWYGMPTKVPAVLVGLSPSQKMVYEMKENGTLPDEAEAARLLDLHKKFMERRGYHEADNWNKERNVVFDSKTNGTVSITEIKRSGAVRKPEEKFAEQNGDKFEPAPEIPMMRSEATEKCSSIKSRCCEEKDGRKTDESKKVGERNTQTNEDSEVVGKSRLLALLQNAISDESILESNIDSSIKSNSENHEVFFVKKRGMEGKLRKPENPSEAGLKTFQDFWKKEKSYCNPQNYRPKTICCEDEIELYITETKKIPTEEEVLVLTENLPSVFDVIRAFEKPNVRKVYKNKDGSQTTQIQIDNERYRISKKGDIAVIQRTPSGRGRVQKEQRKSMPASFLTDEEIFKQKMFDEYMSKLAERIERRQQKVIRVSQSNEKGPEEPKFLDIENEFISKVKERKEKLGTTDDSLDQESLEKQCQEFAKYWQGEIQNLENGKNGLKVREDDKESGGSKRNSVQLLSDSTSDVESLPKHLKELLQVEKEEFPEFLDDFRRFRIKTKAEEGKRSKLRKNLLKEIDEELVLSKGFLFGRGKFTEIMPSSVIFSPSFKATAPRPGVWSPARQISDEKSEIKEENEERKKLEDEPIPPVWTPKSAQASPVLEKKEFRPVNFESPTLPRKKYIQDDKRESSVPPPWQQPGGDKLPEIAKSPSSPALSLPRAPNPTVTLLQKAREGHLPRGAHYLNSTMHEAPTSGESTIEKVEIVTKTESRPRNLEVGPKKIIGIGPTSKEGIPLVLRSEVTDDNKEKWYKRMYDSLHKYGKDDDYVTVKYRTSPSRKGLYSSSSGYQSEPESINYERSTTPVKRRTEVNKENECISVTLPRSRLSLTPRRDLYQTPQPGRIEDYEPGHSSISDLETNKWWDEVLEIFDREEQKSRPIRKTESSKSFTNYASGFISDPQYVYKRTEDELQSPPSSEEQKEAYRIIQKGGEIPLRGLRKPAPERPKDFDTEIEYFPLTPTLTRIRVHKPNITPLSELPFTPNPLSVKTFNYPGIPFGVCNSYSQVQIFPPSLLSLPLGNQKDQKFAVHLQNISGPSDYVQIVPKPRGQKKSPIYANIPIRRSCSPQKTETKTYATFSDLKRVVPSVNSVKPIPETEKPKKIVKKKETPKVVVKKSKIPEVEKKEKKKIPNKEPVKTVKKNGEKKVPEKVQTSKSLKTLTGNLKKKKETKADSTLFDPGSGINYVDLKNLETTEGVMSPIYESVDEETEKPKVQSDMTEVFRSRSFSPEVRRKIFKLPDMNKPIPPKRKVTRTSPALKMWSKMMVSYQKSGSEPQGSNVKFLGNRIERKLSDKKEKVEFGDDIETVRTVKRNKSGDVSIETNRYVKVTRPASLSSVSTRSTIPERRKLLPDLKTKLGSLDLLKNRAKTEPDKKKDTDTFVRSSTTYSVRAPVRKEDDKRKVKVTVAISSKGKELLRRTAGVTTPKKTPVTKSSSSSISSRSGLNRTSPLSDKSTSSSRDRLQFSPTLSTSRMSSYSRTTSPGSEPKIIKKPSTPPSKIEVEKKVVTKSREVSRIPRTRVVLNKVKEDPKKLKKTEVGEKIKKAVSKVNKATETNEVIEGRDLVRTDSFFQNLFLRGPPEEKALVEIPPVSSVLERARRYQRRLIWPETYKSEPSLSLYNFYLNQKRPVSSSRFKNLDRDLYSSRSQSPLGSFHSESFQMKLKRFDSMSLIDDESHRDFSPEAKERSSSEPPLRRSPEQKRMSLSEESSARSSPNSSRSPSCRRIQSFKSTRLDGKKLSARARSASELEEIKRSNLQRDLGQSVSSLNLSNLSDHTEYQAYVLELMHSTRKCERFRELHKFYSNLERMGKLEKTASTGDLRPRLRSEDIIDFDRWKKVRSKERAEAELKTLVDNLVKVQKEKDLLFRTADVEAIRWKGDRGLRIKEKSVEDLKEQFNKHSQEELDSEVVWKKELEVRKDHYKPLWRGRSIGDVTNHLNNTLISYRGRPITLEELDKIQKNTRIGKEYGYSLKAWSSLSSEQVDALKNQLSEIYAQEARKKGYDGSVEYLSECEIVVPKDSSIKSSGEDVLQVRCSSAMSKSQTYTPTVKRKEDIRRSWRKAESISNIPIRKAESKEKIPLPPLPWKSEPKIVRSLSEGRHSQDRYSVLRSRSTSSLKPFTETEKKRLSMTLSKEVIEKMTKASGKGPVFPRETLGALAAAGSKLRDQEIYLTPEERKLLEEFTEIETTHLTKSVSGELESGSGSSETSIKTVIRKDATDVLKKVQYFEELHHSGVDIFDQKEPESKLSEIRRSIRQSSTRKKKSLSSSLENINDYFGQQKQYATALQSKPTKPFRTYTYPEPPKILPKIPSGENLTDKNAFDDKKWIPARYRSPSPVALRSLLGSSSESLFSCRSRSFSPDPTKYYRAYLKMVKSGAVRKLRNKFESWEDLLSLSSDKDFWLPPPRRFASDPELTRDMLRRFGTDPSKVTIRGQEVGDVRWLRRKFEKDTNPGRGRSRIRRVRSPILRDRLMPKINVISKTAELHQQGLETKQIVKAPSRVHELPSSPESYLSLIDYTKDHGGYYYTGEVEKLRRKFERLQQAEKLSILGQMYTSTPDVNELRDIAPYLECSWVAHRHPRVSKAISPEPPKRVESKKTQLKPRPHSSSPVRPKQPLSILKPSYPYPDKFADQKFDPSIHRPKYRYQPEREVDQRYKRGDPDWWRHWTKPTVTFKESPRKYVESEVTIHYKSPVRSEAKAMLSEDELARRQAESMKRIYKEERRRKYLQELQDMSSRRHTDNFTPSQKSPISLNRYDDFPVNPGVGYYRTREYTTDPVLVARGLYDFMGRRPRELAFRRGDIIFIIRKLDKNWCEGELNGVVGLFPLSYVEVIPYNEINMKYGRARAKYDFVPQTSMELSAHKGDMITLIRKIDENWFEGKIGSRTGIIPASYCHVLAMPQASRQMVVEKVKKPVAAPAAHSLIHNGSGLSSKHYYTPYLSGPNSPGPSTGSSTSANLHDGLTSADMLIDEALMQLDEEFDLKKASKSATQPLNVRINPRPEPALYQVLFNHVPNNDDELELVQGETVTVIEKCGDGWYIGSKTSDGKLGIFPGTHVRRIGPEFV